MSMRRCAYRVRRLMDAELRESLAAAWPAAAVLVGPCRQVSDSSAACACELG